MSRNNIVLALLGFLGVYLFAKPAQSSPGVVLRGGASWYGPGYAGRQTANGEIFDPRALTAAHKTLPFNTTVRVSLVDDPSKSVTVRINDRGPYIDGRIIDLSRYAAEVLGMKTRGVADVTVEILSTPPKKA